MTRLLLLPLLVLLLAPAPARAEETHDSFTSSVRIRDHGRCHVGKSDAQVRARLACPDDFRRSLRPCPTRAADRCFWHAPSRAGTRSFVALAGRHHVFRP